MSNQTKSPEIKGAIAELSNIGINAKLRRDRSGYFICGLYHMIEKRGEVGVGLTRINALSDAIKRLGVKVDISSCSAMIK